MIASIDDSDITSSPCEVPSIYKYRYIRCIKFHSYNVYCM